MPPKDKGKDATKQKSLMSFFQKASTGTSSSQPSKKVARKSSAMSITGDASSPPFEPHTPEKKQINARPSVAASSPSSRGASTPPTSDTIDVDIDADMVCDVEEDYDKSVVSVKIYENDLRVTNGFQQVQKKRKIIADSDEEANSPKQKHRAPYSSPIPAKGARVSIFPL